MLKNYFKIAWRNLYRNKTYTLINVLGLVLGTCACLVIYVITSFELSYDTFHPGKERIYRIVAENLRHTGERRQFGFVTDPMAMTARAELSGLETVAGFYHYYTDVIIPDGKKVAKQFEKPKYDIPSDIIVAEPQYFDIFKYQWLAGTPALSLKEPFQVVLSEKEAHKYFGPGSPDQFMGRQVIYADSLRLTVSGIVKDWSGNTDLGFKDFISAATIPHSLLANDIDLKSWGMWNYTTQAFVKLAPGVTRAQVERQLPAFAKKHLVEEEGDKVQLSLQPLSDIHFNNDFEDSFSRKAHLSTLFALMGIAAFILLIAAINFINFSTAQSIRRVREIGIRKVLGSRRIDLIMQFLVETLILTCLAVLISVILVNPVLSLFRAFIPAGVGFHLFSPSTLVFLSLLIIVTSVGAGFYPARFLSSYLPVISLKGEGYQQINQKSWLRHSLIIFQFTIALLFIIGTWIIGDQIRFLLSKDMGFSKDAIVNIQTPGGQAAAAKKDVLVQQIAELPGVAMVCTSEGTPAAKGHRGTEITYKGRHEIKLAAEMHVADDRFLSLYEMKLLAGRDLRHSDTMNEVLLNESCARGLGFTRPADAVGQLVESGQKDRPGQGMLPVVGVVADFHSRSLREPVRPVFITSNSGASRVISVKLSMQGRQVADLKALLTRMEASWKEAYPDKKFDYAFFDETIAAFYDKEQKTARIMNTAMLISIFISCMGLFGVTTFMAGQRTREIGIRKVLGASVAGIVRLLSIDFIRLVGIAILIATPIAWYGMHKWLQDFAYRTTISAWVFVLSGLIAILIALATISFQAIKAAIANPVKSLRSE